MDKYQKFYIDNYLCRGEDKTRKCVYAEGGDTVCGEMNYEKITITVNQAEDITVTKYKAVLDGGNNTLLLKGVEINYGKGWEKLNHKLKPGGGSAYGRAYYEVPLDFENRVTEVKLLAADGLVEDFIFKVVYNEADRDNYYKKKAEAARRDLILKSHIECTSCMNFIQVYFVPCNEDFGSAELTLYRGKDQFMYKYESAPGVFSITAMGLGHGDYSFIFREYDKKKNLLFETDKVEIDVYDKTIRKDVR